jgi:hypothetical protein
LGLIIGAGFSNVVTSLVSDIILPPISLLSSNSRNLESQFFVLRQGETEDAIYNTLEQAAADGKIARRIESVVDCNRSCIHGIRFVHSEGKPAPSPRIIVPDMAVYRLFHPWFITIFPRTTYTSSWTGYADCT